MLHSYSAAHWLAATPVAAARAECRHPRRGPEIGSPRRPSRPTFRNSWKPVPNLMS